MTKKQDHICVKQAICFECFKSGMEGARARRQAWAQRALPFENAAPTLTPRALAHRQQMLAHLSRLAERVRSFSERDADAPRRLWQ